MGQLQKGTGVCATERITEQNFLGEDLFVHAERGDVGIVRGQESNGEWLTVEWQRHRTVSDCHITEINWLRKPSEPQVVQ